MADNKNIPGSVDMKKMKEALALADKYFQSTKKTSDQMNMQQEAWNGISSSIFGISGADWFKKVPKTTEELAKQAAQIKEIDAQLKVAGDSLDNKFKNAFSGIQKSAKKAADSTRKSFQIQSELISVDFKKLDMSPSKENQDALSKLVKDLKESKLLTGDYQKIIKKLPKELRENNELLEKAKEFYKEEIKIRKKGTKDLTGGLAFINEIEDEHVKQLYLEAIASGKIDELVKERGYEALNILSTNKAINSVMGEDILAMIAFRGEAEESKKVLGETTKDVRDISKGFMLIGKNLARDLIPRLLEFDKIIHETQKDTGIMFTENSAKMTALSVKTAEFGMSVKDTAEFMGALGEELKTTNFDVLAGAAGDLKAVQLATGMATENLSAMAGEMMRAGHSSKDVEIAISEANDLAKQFGVSSKNVLDGMGKNISKMRTMGFIGGEKSLGRMVATAERLRMSVDEIFDTAKRARSIEGAMEMAAELQLAGGSFANINPMDLLASARKGPEELQKILTKMGGDIGNFNKNGEYEFDPIDSDRLQMVADATGQSVDSLSKMIQKNAEDNKKLSLIPPATFTGLVDANGKKINPDDAKAMISDQLDIKTGLPIKGSLLDKSGVKDISKMTKEQVKAIYDKKKSDQKTLEEQAKENQNFEAAVTALKDSLLNLIGYLQPVVDVLTWIVQALIKVAQGPGKWILLLAAAFMVIPALTVALGKAAFAMNPKNWGDVFKKGSLKEAMIGKSGKVGVTDDLGKKIKDTQDSGVKAQGAPKEGGLKSLAEGLKAMGEPKVFIGIGATALAGPALLLLLPALPGLIILAGVGALSKLVKEGFQTIADGFGIMGRDFKNIALGAAAIAIVSVSLGVFALAVGLFSGIGWSTLLMAGVSLLGLVGILALVGLIVGTGAGVGILLGALALVAISAALAVAAAGLIVFASGMQSLSTVDWSSFTGVGAALTSVAIGLAAFALAGLMFMNPLMLIGMMLMVGTLAAISIVLIPLAEALDIGGKGLDSMAAGALKLTESLGKIDFEKLNQIKEFAQSMTLASLAGGAMSSMVAVIEALGKVTGGGDKNGNSAGTESRPIIIQLKLPNGREIERVIINDIDKAS